MNTVTVTLPIPDPKLHSHAKGGWRSKTSPTKTLRNMAHLTCIAAQRGGREKWKKATLTYRFFFPDNRRRDGANAMYSMKAAVDGVVDSGLIPDDCWQMLRTAGVECGIDRDNPRTELVFERVE